MDLLSANDTQGQRAASWYAASAPALTLRPALQGAIRADVCVIGAGYTGLSTALHLAQRGVDVVVIDAHHAGFGASGRNGGQLGSGQRLDQQELEALIGADAARAMWDMGEDAKALVNGLIQKHSIDCALKPGVAWSGSSARSVRELHAYAAHMEAQYGYPLEVLDKEAFYALCPSPSYCGGIVDMGAAHLHPLRFALGLAKAAEQAGARIFESTRAAAITPGPRPVVQTAEGQITADHVVLACNGYLGNLMPGVARKVMPINNFIAATAPLGAETTKVLRRDIAVADDRFVINYFRLSEDGRLLFGGGESYGYRFPKDLDAVVRKPLAQIYPHLAQVPFDYVWGGTLAITMHRTPLFARPAAGVWSASGYSGHGVGNATQAGRILAQGILGDLGDFTRFAALPAPPFPGGARLRAPLLALGMRWYALRDQLGV